MAGGGQRIGLLGGSFNPAHEGHRHISLLAMTRLQLDAVWWLVSPQNPLKDSSETAAYEQRFKRAQQVAGHPRIIVSDFEQRAHTRYTIDTIKRLQQSYAGHRFVWLMGADNLVQFHRWKAWEEIAARVPLCVIDRPGGARKALTSRTAHRLAAHRIDQSDAPLLANEQTPAWCFITGPTHPASSTAIRHNGLW